MARLWERFVGDEAGFVASAELVLIATLVVIGLLTGLATLRDQVLFELGDVAESLSNWDQSYSFAALTGHTSLSRGVDFLDQEDFCDAAFNVAGQPPGGLAVVGGLSER